MVFDQEDTGHGITFCASLVFAGVRHTRAGVRHLWAAQSVWPARADALHAGLHVVTVVGVNCYIGFLV